MCCCGGRHSPGFPEEWRPAACGVRITQGLRASVPGRLRPARLLWSRDLQREKESPQPAERCEEGAADEAALRRGWLRAAALRKRRAPLFSKNSYSGQGRPSRRRIRVAAARTAPAEPQSATRNRPPLREEATAGAVCRPCKPGSVPGPKPGPLSFIYDGGHPPPPATYPPASGEQPLTAGIHGLATHGTYCRTTSLPPRWALTPPFHPYPAGMRIPAGRSFSVTLPCPHGHQVVSLRGALRCPDFPPPDRSGGDRAGLRCKGSEKRRFQRRIRGFFSPGRTTGRACSASAGRSTRGSRPRRGGG